MEFAILGYWDQAGDLTEVEVEAERAKVDLAEEDVAQERCEVALH